MLVIIYFFISRKIFMMLNKIRISVFWREEKKYCQVIALFMYGERSFFFIETKNLTVQFEFLKNFSKCSFDSTKFNMSSLSDFFCSFNPICFSKSAQLLKTQTYIFITRIHPYKTPKIPLSQVFKLIYYAQCYNATKSYCRS